MIVLDSKRVLVAGAAGMAGVNIVRALLDTHPGVTIRGTWHHTAPLLDDPRVEYHQADLTRREDCQRIASGCDYAILSAANTGGACSALSQPSLQVTDNLVMDALLLEALHEAGISRAVYVSSASVYQESDGAIREEQLDLNQNPHTAYLGVGWAKRAAEKLCAFWHEKYGMEIVIARSANIFGPYARFDPKRSNFIPALIRKAVDRLDPFEVWGSPEVSRDVILATDFATAVVRLLETDTIAFDVFNLGYGKPVSVGEVVDWALAAAGHHPSAIHYTESESAPTTIRHRVLDCNKLSSMTGWHPAHDPASGIAITTEWWLRHRHEWQR